MKISFNSSQLEAVSHNEGPCYVLAGPGSGKTAVITQRTKNLITKHGVNPSNILVITYTKAAAMEMKQRFCTWMGEEKTRVTFGTFHAVFFKILKYAYNYDAANILREEEKYQLDLWAANYIQFEEAGLLPKNIHVSGICTCCNQELFFSHRASHGKRGNLNGFLSLC